MEDEEQKVGFGDEESIDRGDTTTRARNRTMMLTPEMAVEVRSRLGTSEKLPMGGGGGDDWSRVPDFGREDPNTSYREHEERSRGRAAAFPEADARGAYQGAARVAPDDDRVLYKSVTPLVGFLVSFDKDSNGKYLELRTGRLIVTSEAESAGNAIIIPHESVSPMHAVLRIVEGEPIQILDQLSEFGTKILRQGADKEEVLNGDKSTVVHGDRVFFGERAYHVCLVDRPQSND
jgi:hypothetical protein